MAKARTYHSSAGGATLSSVGLLLGALGLVLFVSGYLHNDTRWVLAREAFVIQPGGRAEVSLTPDLDAPCEIEIQFDDEALSEQWRQDIYRQDRPSKLDITWQASSADGPIAQGDAHEYLYLRGSNSSPLAQLVFRLLNIADHKPGPGTRTRGIARIPCRAGQSYSVAATVGDSNAGLEGVDAALVVRVSRAVGDRSLRESYPLFASAAALLCCSALALAIGGRRRKRGRTE